MIRHLFIFLGTFVAGAVIALAARTALFKPYADHTGHPPAGGDYAPLVSNRSAPTASADPHASHNHNAAAPVNTVCAICGMDVDPSLPTADYKGKKIGFGCAACPPKFKANPDRWGPAALRNEVVEK